MNLPLPIQGAKLRSYLPKFLSGNSSNFSRRHERHDCVAVSTMALIEIGADIPGVVLELSRGGCSFRPASVYMLERNGELVSVRTEYFTAEGRIRTTRPEAYGIQFFHEIEEDEVNRLVSDCGGGISTSFLAKHIEKVA